MCGIIGFHSLNATESDLEILKKVMVESKIRGKHASGIAWCNHKGKILSVVKPLSIDKLVDEFDFNTLTYNGKVSMIAHARYSTSDIKYNQPIVGNNLAIVHNGVVTQSNPNTWEETYGYKCKTKNDSELLLRAIENDDDVLKTFKHSSISMIALKNDGTMNCVRNSIRPLWIGSIGKGTVYASTYDILNRAGVKDISKIVSSDCVELQRRCMINAHRHSD